MTEAFLASRLEGRRLVVFDVDGTLYDQRKVRRSMAALLMRHLLGTGKISTVRTLRAYRRAREATADAEDGDFEATALASAARDGGITEDRARTVVEEWMHRRPLPLISRHRYPGVAELFAELRRRGTVVGVLSDYPAWAKLRAMELEPDLVAAAGDPGIEFQKPHPAGLAHLMGHVGVLPAQTLLIGDRLDRDGAAARRCGVDVLIRSDKRIGADVFRSFDAFGIARSKAA